MQCYLLPLIMFETIQKLQGSQANCAMVNRGGAFETIQKLQGSQAYDGRSESGGRFETIQKLQGSQACSTSQPQS